MIEDIKITQITIDNIDLSDNGELRVAIERELANCQIDIDNIKNSLDKNQQESLFLQCKESVIESINGCFGLSSAVLKSKDGGNVHTTHNVRQGIYADKQKSENYDNRGQYDPYAYHNDSMYISINRQQTKLKNENKLLDYMTGKKIGKNDATDLDHIVSAKTIHDDRGRVLAEIDGASLANTESNLAITDRSLNRSKKDKDAYEFLSNRDRRLNEIKSNEAMRGFLTDSEKNELKKLHKQKQINDEIFLDKYNKSKTAIDSKVDKAYYTSTKPYKELAISGAIDSSRMVIYSTINIVLREFISGMMTEFALNLNALVLRISLKLAKGLGKKLVK